MARVKKNSRRIFLGAAFVSAMAGSGALLGFIGGLMLMLLGHAVLRTDDGMVSIMITCGALGLAAATLWSVLLVTRPDAHALAWQHASPKQQGIEGK